jgi:glycosyltransferase involved in cell wall biosynthesis
MKKTNMPHGSGVCFRRWIQEKYNWEKIAEQTIQVYQDL